MPQPLQLTVAEAAKRAGRSKWSIYKYIREGKLHKAQGKVSAVELDHLMEGKNAKKNQEKPGLYYKGSLTTLHATLQEQLGGSVSNCKWIADDAKPTDLDSYHFSRKELESKMFVDTVIFAVPATFRVVEEEGRERLICTSGVISQGVADRFFFRGDTKEKEKYRAARIAEEKQRGHDIGYMESVNVPLHGVYVYGTPGVWSGDAWKFLAKTTLPTGVYNQTDQYNGYQLYRYSTSGLNSQALLSREKPSVLGQKAHIVRYDVTANFPGFVSDARVELLDMELKENAHYVGDHCHTYICNDAVAAALASKKTEDTELLESLNLELSTATNPVEVKIYDKIRYMLEVGTVAQPYSGYQLANFYVSSKKEIQDALRKYPNGLARVELRLRGAALNASYTAITTALAEYSARLCAVYAYEQNAQEAINRFLSSVKACTAILVQDEQEKVLEARVAQWVNSRTLHLNGNKIPPNRMSEFNFWCEYMSNRKVPLVQINAICKGPGVYKVTDYSVSSPIDTVKYGLPSAKRYKYKGAEEMHPFDIPFRISPIHGGPLKARDVTKGQEYPSLMLAKKAARKSLINYRNYNKTIKKEAVLPIGKTTAIRDLIKRGDIKQIKPKHVKEGLIGEVVTIKKDIYFASPQKNGRKVRLLPLSGHVKIGVPHYTPACLRITMYGHKVSYNISSI